VFWVAMLCGTVGVLQHFRKAYHLNLQDQEVSQARNQQELGGLLERGKLLAWFFFQP
jgi:hypothetical protein